MSKLNLLVHINGYEDENPTNNPNRNNFKWNRDLQGICIEEPNSRTLSLAPGQTHSLFSGSVSTSDDGTTEWDLAPKSGSSNTYRISHSGGTAPVFRTSRDSAADATTEVTVTKNAKVVTFTSTGGTVFDLIANGVIVGDLARIGTSFNALNQGKFKIIAITATSFSIENEIGQVEGPIVLGATFADQINIHSQDGVQIGDKVDIIEDFSPVTQSTYDITDVSHDYIEFLSLDSLPVESGVSNSPALFIYRDAKKFLYIESDQKAEIKIDGTSVTNKIEPFQIGTSKKVGIFMSSSTIKSAEITNTSQSTSNIFYVTAE
jgi:hypothetical protein